MRRLLTRIWQCEVRRLCDFRWRLIDGEPEVVCSRCGRLLILGLPTRRMLRKVRAVENWEKWEGELVR